MTDRKIAKKLHALTGDMNERYEFFKDDGRVVTLSDDVHVTWQKDNRRWRVICERKRSHICKNWYKDIPDDFTCEKSELVGVFTALHWRPLFPSME